MLREKKTEADSPNLFSCLTQEWPFPVTGAGIPTAHLPPSPWEPLKEPLQPKYSQSCQDAILPGYIHLKPVLMGCHEIPDPTSHLSLLTTHSSRVGFWKKTPMEGATKGHACA